MYIAYAIIKFHQPPCSLDIHTGIGITQIHLQYIEVHLWSICVCKRTHMLASGRHVGKDPTLLIPRLCFVSKSLSRLLMAHCRILSLSLSFSCSHSVSLFSPFLPPSPSPFPFLSVCFRGSFLMLGSLFLCSKPLWAAYGGILSAPDVKADLNDAERSCFSQIVREQWMYSSQGSQSHNALQRALWKLL